MKSKLKTIIQSSFVQGGFLLTATNFFIGFSNYIFNVLAARQLGPIGYGEITTLFSYLSILSVPIVVITTIIIQKIGAAESNKFDYVHSMEEWCIAKMKKWWFVFFIMILAIPFLPRITNLTPIVAWALVPLFLTTLFSAFYDASLQGLHLFLWFSVLSIAITLIKLVGALSTYIIEPALIVILIFLLIGSFIKLFASKKIFDATAKKSATNTIEIKQRIRHIMRHPSIWTTIISILSITLLSNIDIIFVKKFFSSTDAGVYGSWSLFAKIILYAIGPLLSLGFIFFSSKEHEELHTKTFAVLLSVLAFVGVTSYVFYIFAGSFIITMFFGDKFTAVIPFLHLASIFGTLYVLITYMNNYFLAKTSKYTFILPICMPLYIMFLFVIPKQLVHLIQLNIFFTAVVALLYLLAYMHTIAYNQSNGR